MHGYALGVLTLALAACSKTESPPGGIATAVPSETATIAITGTPPASASAVASASPSATPTETPTPTPTPSAKTAASAKPATSATGTAALAAAASVKKEETLPPLKAAAARFSGKNFTLDAASPGCRVDTPCTMTLRLAASGDYHVNKEYPYKFIAGAAPGVQFLGNGEANTFSRSAGDFREDGEKTGTMTVRFKPTTAGEARVTGTYKMSVCSAENCQIETQAVQLAVPVM